MAGVKKGSGGVSLHPYAARLPSVKKTGNTVLDEDTESKIQMLRELVSGCLENLNHVAPLFNKLRERQRIGETDDDAPFKNVKMLRDLEKDFLLNFVVTRSDLAVHEVLKALERDPMVVQQLLAFETQIPLTLRWREELWSREVTFRFLADRGDAMGNRLQKFKASGGFKNGAVQWTLGCYKPNFQGEENRMVSITHVPTQCTVTVANTVVIVKGSVSMIDNWSDMDAAFLVPPYPPLKCHSLFKSGEGPLQFPNL